MKTKFIKRIAAAGMAVACMVATTISAFALEGGSTWNENGYSVDMKVYADYLTGYARIDVVYKYGGIYMDTDVELVKELDTFLNDRMYCGWEMVSNSCFLA